jgi:hypothetical protein
VARRDGISRVEKISLDEMQIRATDAGRRHLDEYVVIAQGTQGNALAHELASG